MAKGSTAHKKGRNKKAQDSSSQATHLRAHKSRAKAARDIEPLLEKGTNRDVAALLLTLVALISLLAVVAPTSAPVTNAIANFYHLGFGLGAYVLPIALLALAVVMFLREQMPVSGRSLAGAALVFVAVCTILSLMVPNSTITTAAMFETENLISSGGYLGAFIASFLQKAFGKTVSLVLAIGLAALGCVLIGFSISAFVQRISQGTRNVVQKHRGEVNDTPWGSAEASSQKLALQAKNTSDASPRLFDASASAPTTYLGNRKTSVLDDMDDVDEDPFVDVSDKLAQERTETVLIPVKDRYVDAQGQEIESESMLLDATTGEQRKIPDFLQAHMEEVAASDLQTSHTDMPSRTTSAPAAEESDADVRELPAPSLLKTSSKTSKASSTSKELEQTAAALQSTLQEFGLRSSVVGWIAGPTVTTFKVQPGEGERVSRITSLEDDIALTLATDAVRIFAPIPGTSLVGIEIPNHRRQNVLFGDILPYVSGGPLEFALGRDAEGAPMVADLAKMPHLLIAGTTGSGKSVVISSIVMSLLMRTFPEDVRLIMIDPKRVEFAPYDGLPHLYVPVVTEPKQAASALQWAVSEMERRLKIFERLGVRKISTFNERQATGEYAHYDNPPSKLPYLVIVIDELSDLMMVAGKDVEASIVRIAQLGRAAGIHMIVATQRPSSNVVTGLIKANITNRIGLTVATGIDSRVILDTTGAEKLTGQGDMLFSRVDWGKPKRIQGCFVSDEEIVAVVSFVREQSKADYHEEILSVVTPAAMTGTSTGARDEDDPLLWDAARIVVDSQLGSTSGLQRRLKVGYARAGRIMDMLEEKGIVGPASGSKPREVLLDMEALQALIALESPLSDDEIGGAF